MPLILILLLAVFQCSITNYLIMNPDYYQLGPYTWESSEFRSMKLGTMLSGKASIDYDMLTTLMIEHDYDLTGVMGSFWRPGPLITGKSGRPMRPSWGILSIFRCR